MLAVPPLPEPPDSGSSPFLVAGGSNAASLGAAIIPLSPWAVLIAAALLLVNGFVSARFSLGLHRTLALAASRC